MSRQPLSLSVMVLVVLAHFTWAQPQPALPGAPAAAPAPGAAAGRGDPFANAQQAADYIKNKLAASILNMVAKGENLTVEDCQVISDFNQQAVRYQAQFDPATKGYSQMVDAWVAFFQNKPEDALKLAKRANQLAPNVSDVSDTLLTMALFFEDYASAKQVLEVRANYPLPQPEPQPVLLPGVVAARPKPSSEPNRAATAPAAPKMTPAQSKWAPAPVGVPGQPGGSYAGMDPMMAMMMMANEPSARINQVAPPAPAAPGSDPNNPSATRRSANPNRPRLQMTNDGVLKLPVDAMPSQGLGQDFSALQLRTINGSFYQYNPGQGGILCVMLWTVPRDGQTGRLSSSEPASSATAPDPMTMMMMMGGGMPAGMTASSGAAQLPQPATDLGTNMAQFGKLFAQTIATGKVSFLAINLDSARQAPTVINLLLENPWPWANCAVADPLNKSWSLNPPVTPALVLVDTKNKIRYIGPVGGFLPQSLLTMELTKAVIMGAAGMPNLPAAVPGPNATMGGAGAAKSVAGQPAPLPKTPGAAAAPQTAAAPQPAPAAAAPMSPGFAKESNSQAQQMIQSAKLSLRVGTRMAALNSLDQVLERYPQTYEADEARQLIKQILQDFPEYVSLRKSQKKYTGE